MIPIFLHMVWCFAPAFASLPVLLVVGYLADRHPGNRLAHWGFWFTAVATAGAIALGMYGAMQ